MKPEPESPPPGDVACVRCGCSDAKPDPECDGTCPCEEWLYREEQWVPHPIELED